jgi:hypothetical protein
MQCAPLLALAVSRSWTVASPDSAEFLATRREAAAKLRDAVAKEPLGTAEVAELAREWSDFQTDLRSLAVPDVGVAWAAAGLAGHTAVFPQPDVDTIGPPAGGSGSG